MHSELQVICPLFDETHELVTCPVHHTGKDTRMVQNLSNGGALLRAARPTFGTLVQHYLDGEARLRKGALERDPPLLRDAVRSWEDRHLDNISRSDCEWMVKSMVTSCESFATVWLRCITVRRMFRIAVDAGLIDTNPWHGVTLPRPLRSRVLEFGEELRLTGLLGPGWGRLVTVAVGTGLRPSELMNLTPAHRVGAWLRLTADISADGRARVVPLRPEVAMALDDQTPTEESRRYWPYSESSADERVRRMTVSLGWQPLTLLDLRRTFGTRCAEAGMRRSVLQAIMGHSNPETTARYYAHLEERV